MSVEPFAPSRQTALALLRAAILAPSADNQHHVRFRLAEDGVRLLTDTSFAACDVPHRRLLTLISYGAVVENLRIALARHGYTFPRRWFGDASDPTVILDLRWADLAAIEPGSRDSGLARQIEQRHTNRRFFRGPPLALGPLDAVVDVADVHLRWCDDRPARRALLRLIRLAETARFGSAALHEELFGSVDFSAGWTAATTEHLAPGSLEIEPPLRIPFKALSHWRVMRAANRLGASRLFGLRAGDIPARTAPHLGVVTSTLPPEQAALATGAAFQRIWLAAQAEDYALQPMVASAILSVTPDGDHGLDARTFDRLRSGWKALLDDASMPMVVFRLGSARPASARSGRKPIEDYLV